jgi:aminopeptidase N
MLGYRKRYESLSVPRAGRYAKGAVFLDHLRHALGERAFWTGLCSYTIAAARRTAAASDFLAAMVTGSGQPLERWLEGYLDNADPSVRPSAWR